jgi:hypothetical protein
MLVRTLFGLGCALALGVAAVSAQPSTARLRGTIVRVDGALLTVKSRGGDTLKVKLAEGVRVTAVVKASLADIGPGSFVGTTAMPEANGTWRAVEVHIFPEALRGVGEGDRPWDLEPRSTMTNGTVDRVRGHIAGTAGETLTINYRDGEKKIEMTPDTVIVTFAPGGRGELKPGAAVIITAVRQADGSFVASRVSVGRGIVPPM